MRAFSLCLINQRAGHVAYDGLSMKKVSWSIPILVYFVGFMPLTSMAQDEGDVYSDFPVTLKGYAGNATSSVSYEGAIARHVLHNSLRALAREGGGGNPVEASERMMSYFRSTEAGRSVVAPASKPGFVIRQSGIDQLASGWNLADAAYRGSVPGWPGQKNSVEVLEEMIRKAAATEGGHDPVNGYDYAQLISKTVMGAVFYNQAVGNYLEEPVELGRRHEREPGEPDRHYTGLEHIWDQAFGHFGVPARALQLEERTIFQLAKGRVEAAQAADMNRDGMIDLLTEMTFAYGSYSASLDKEGKSTYLRTITQAFVDGRKLIAEAGGEALGETQHRQLMKYAEVIKTNWEKVIAEATYKYTGVVYKDLGRIQAAMEKGGDLGPIMRNYAKHWSEMKGLSMALQMGGRDVHELGRQLNRLIGFGPVLPGNTRVVGIDHEGNYIQAKSQEMDGYMDNMIKVQRLLDQHYDLKVRLKEIGDSVNDL